MFSHAFHISGSLLTRNLNGLVQAEDVIQNSEYLQTYFFVINKSIQAAWLNEYEGLIPMGAVPRSARQLAEDGEYLLYGVVLLKKYAEEYVKEAAKRKYVPRTDFSFDAEVLSQNWDASSKLESEVQSQWVSICEDVMPFSFSVDFPSKVN